MSLPRIILQPKRARPFFARHPWVFAGAIARTEEDPQDGDEVDLISHGETFVARGLYNSQSNIRVRLYTWDENQPLDKEFWKSRLESAIRLRKEILNLDLPGQACRLVFSEGDGLSGMVIDKYDEWVVVQFTSLGLANRRDDIVRSLVELLSPKGIYLRTERGIGQLEGVELQDGRLWGETPDEPVVIEENGLEFFVQIDEGQKTGYYLDQRDNRVHVAKYCPEKRVLDAFCYSGGFGIHAAAAGATEVVSVDVSESALKLANANAELNGLDNITLVKSDVFDHLDKLEKEGEKFDVVVLDPPKFARKRNAIEEALRGYRRLQTLGVRLLSPHGILAVFCCTGLIDMPTLEELLGQIAESEKRDIQILERHGQAADHPVSVTCLESNYLKGLVCRVV
ncbi:MAG: class I SAM-dependent rRNA methyltransferase [Gemmataceae bacterium]